MHRCMKKIALADQLDLSKEIIADLSPEQLQEIEGGAAPVEVYSCFFTSCNDRPRDAAAE